MAERTSRRAIRYASAPAGSGKTHGIVRRAHQRTRDGYNVLLLQPTKLLIDKTKVEEFDRLADPPIVKVFHGDTVGSNVAYQLAEYLAAPEDRPQVVMATHQALARMPFLANASSWDLLIDETLQVDREQAHVVPSTHPLITDHIRVAQHDGVYGRVILRSPHEIQALARNPEEDELLERFRETANVLATKHWRSFVHIEQYQKLLGGSAKTLNIHSVLMPSLVSKFASVLVAGANLEDTGLFRLWSKMGVVFAPDKDLLDGLRYRKHGNGHLVTIHFALDRNWSRTLLEQSTDGKHNLERLRDGALAVFKGREFLWQANKSVPNNFFRGVGQRLPNSPHGLNEFDAFHNAAFLPALNATPPHARFLQSRGLTPDEIDRQGYCGVAYQAIMRTSLRDAGDQNLKNIVVPDQRVAEYLAEMLPGAIIKKMDTGIADQTKKGGRPKVHDSNADKMRNRRVAEAEKRTALLAQVFLRTSSQDGDQSGCQASGTAVHGDEEPIALRRGPVAHDRPFCATLYSHIRSTAPEAYLYCATSEHFALALQAAHERQVESKAANALFSPAIFDPLRVAETKRGVGNIVYMQNIVLDFEGGELRPYELPHLFPDLQLIVTNSYGHTTEAPRYRAIILTSSRIGPDAYEALWDAIAAKLRDAGYVKSPRAKSTLKRSGLDYSKRSAASLFYLPAQAAAAEYSFFTFYDDEGRRPLDPETWLRNVQLHGGGSGASKTARVDDAACQTAISKWRAALPENGNAAFFSLGLELKSIGLSTDEIEQTLKHEASFGRSPAERRNQIASVMKSLRRKGRAV